MTGSAMIRDSAAVDGLPSLWQRIGARRKAENVDALWTAHASLPPARTRVLEVGARDGAVMEELSTRGYEAHGAVTMPSGMAPVKRGLQIEAFDGDRLPFDDDSFDLVVLSHYIEHVEHPRMILREAARVAPWLCVEVSLEYGWRTPEDFQPTRFNYLNIYDRKLLRHLLQSVGLQPVAERIGGPSLAAFRFLRGRVAGTAIWAGREVALKLAPRLAHKAFTYHAAVLCRSRGTGAE